VAYLNLSNWCSTTSDYVLRALPELSKEYHDTAENISSKFTGDPSYMAYNGAVEQEDEDPEAPPVERFREVHRLSYTVQVNIQYAFIPDQRLI